MRWGNGRLAFHSWGPFGPDAPGRLRVGVRPPDAPIHLAVDLYDTDGPLHPEGHYGWWTWEIDRSTEVEFLLDAGQLEAVRRADGVTPQLAWTNEALDPAAAGSIDVHVVVRDAATQIVLQDRVVRWMPDRERHAACVRVLDVPDYVRALAKPSLGLAPGATVHVVAADVREGDAIGNLALDVARALRHHDVPVRLWANHTSEAAREVTGPADDLVHDAMPEDVILYQYSIGDPALDAVLAAPAAKVCFYQGVTPPELMAIDPGAAASCARGLAELPRLAGFDGFLAGSRATADELRAAIGPREVRVCPPTLNLGRFDEIEAARLALPDGKLFLYVGRFAPHKGLDVLLEAFAAHHALDPGWRLVLAGAPASPLFAEHLETRRAMLAPEVGARVHGVDRPDDAQLKTLYAECSAYVSASEHEGFCIPVVEAMAFGKPVFARATPAVRETLGDTACLWTGADPEAIAAAWHAVLADPDARARQLATQERRLAELRDAADGRVLWEALARAASGRGAPAA